MQINCSRDGLCHVVGGDLIFCGEACIPVGVPALCCCSGTCLEAALVCHLDERAEVQPCLIGICPPVRIFHVARVRSTACHEVDAIH